MEPNEYIVSLVDDVGNITTRTVDFDPGEAGA
jgi:hypothetical protein